jgi:hypothetical protein
MKRAPCLHFSTFSTSPPLTPGKRASTRFWRRLLPVVALRIRKVSWVCIKKRRPLKRMWYRPAAAQRAAGVPGNAEDTHHSRSLAAPEWGRAAGLSRASPRTARSLAAPASERSRQGRARRSNGAPSIPKSLVLRYIAWEAAAACARSAEWTSMAI